MATKPLTSEAIALTEKKMDMTLDDIIKMSKNPATKTKKQHRVPNKSQKAFSNAVQDKAFKVRQYMGSRSSVRQGVLAQRRSNFQGNHFPLTNEVARKATYAPARNRAFNGSRVPDKMNRARVGAVPVQRRSNGGYAKSHQQQQQDITVTKQRPQTLDMLFANMKEQRMKVFSNQNNNGGAQQRNGNGGGAQQRNGGGAQQRNGGGAQRNGGGRPRLPWVRGRVGN